MAARRRGPHRLSPSAFLALPNLTNLLGPQRVILGGYFTEPFSVDLACGVRVTERAPLHHQPIGNLVAPSALRPAGRERPLRSRVLPSD